MNFDNAKENIQPLACGRDAKRLEIALNAELNDEAQQELQRQKSEYEEKIQNYCGDDPLEIWFEYISWVEQCFPKSGKECSIDELLKKCLLQFGSNPKYFQDSRFIKIYIKFIDTQENPIEIYQQLYNHGIGTMVSDFYICWAYYYDLMDNFNKANEIFVKGIDARAQPIEELHQAQKTFSLTIPARLLSRDEDDKLKFLSAMEEKRQALTSLRAHKHTHVGSLRTGNVIKSSKPGKLSSSSKSSNKIDNRVVNVFQDPSKKSDDSMHFLSSQPDTSITHSLIDKARDKENKKEPGPWSKTNTNQSQNVIKSTTGHLAFSIMEDSEDKPNEKLGEEFAIKLPPNFQRSNLPQSEYSVPLFISEKRAFSLPRYDKIMLYPGNGNEYSLDELMAWKYFKKFNIQNKFVLKYDKFWTNEGLNLKSRIPPHFPNQNQKQSEFLTEVPPKVLQNNQIIHVCGWNNYDYSEDLSYVDFMAKRWYAIQQKNKTVIMSMSLDETVICDDNNQSIVMLEESNSPLGEKNNVLESPNPSPAPKKIKISSIHKISTHMINDENEKVCQVKTEPNAKIDVFKIFTDETDSVKQDTPKFNIEPLKIVDSTEPCTIQSNFKIFEDVKEFEFKEPPYTGTIKKCFAKPQQIPEARLEINEPEGPSTEETFSTQNFVMFIKQQETSTPLKNKRCESHNAVSKENQDQNIQLPVKITSSESLSSPEIEVIPKQLSVIMETSETNTGGTNGSGVNTKSSVDGNESSKFVLNCNQTAKSKTCNNDQNLSTIHENSCPREHSVKDVSKFTTLGLSGLKLTDDSVTFPKSLITKDLCQEDDELCALFTKTPDKNVKLPIRCNKPPLKSDQNTSKAKHFDDSEDELLEFFKKSPKMRKRPFAQPAPIVVNDSLTIPCIKDILLNKCDNTAITNVTATSMGTSMAMPKNQSIMHEFTENLSIFGQHHKSKLTSFTTTKLNDENSDLIRFSTKKNETDHFVEGDLGKSIYEFKGVIDDENNHDSEESEEEHSFQHKIINLNQTRQQIETCVSSENIDPWNIDLCSAFLEDLDFFNYLEKRDDCVLINKVPSLKIKKKIEIADKTYSSIKYISKGAYGYIYKGKDMTTDKTVVLKQERPPNCWEYYISLIITERIIIEFLPRFMVIDNALIGNNSSIFVSDYVPYGTLLDVCNKIYTATSRHLDELVVMVLAIELFTIVDLLHSADIIHGDIKPDNFLLMTTLSLDSNRPLLKLIDYGNSIDMQRFPPNTTFKTSIKTEDFICTEMIDGRPWTYQTDLYCLAGTLHVLLFGYYMKTGNKLGKINILTKFPRYLHKTVWERIFISLLNVPDCQTFPNLQDFKLNLKEILADKEKLVQEKILNFNRHMA